MTRINLICPSKLVSKHLVAEYRELPRVFAYVRKASNKGLKPKDIKSPDSYVLGKGHVTFFFTRLGWLVSRFQSLVEEMLRRGYNPKFRNVKALTQGIPKEWFKDWVPSKSEVKINRQRINERLKTMNV